MTTLPLQFEPPKPFALRPYQVQAIETLRARVVAGSSRLLLVAPCGAGKMLTMASIIKLSSVPALFVCHRQELIDQCANELAVLGVTAIGVMRGDDDRVDPSAKIQVASIQTLARRDKPTAGLILIDEAHRAASESYRKHVFDAYPGAVIIGFTASPTRLDGKPLGADGLFQTLDVIVTYSSLIEQGFIVAPECYSSPLVPDLSDVRIVAGDYEEGALGEIMSRQDLVGNVVEHYLKLAARGQPQRRRGFVFAVNIQHSLLLCERFREAGVRVAHLDGDTPDKTRRAMIRQLREGDLELISNCNVLLEGVDVPPAKIVVHARPTRSLVLWLQSTGRILRPWGDVTPMLLDHGDGYTRHGPPHEDRRWTLNQGVIREKGPPVKICKQCFAYVLASAAACPYCGFLFPKQVAEERAYKETGDNLERRNDSPEQRQRRFFEKTAEKARFMGFKPGFVSVKYKEEFGAWPPRAWSNDLMASFHGDINWQDRLAARGRQREEREMEVKRREEAIANAPPARVIEAEPREETFGEWWDDQ